MKNSKILIAICLAICVMMTLASCYSHDVCSDENKDHKCDFCSENVGKHVDAGKDHVCDYGCKTAIGVCEDADFDHICDYGCSMVISECVDKDLDHKCDYGCGKAFGTCEDADKDHVCDYGCGKALSSCTDESPKDHKCDVCEKPVGDGHETVEGSHNCGICGSVISDHSFGDWSIADDTKHQRECYCGEIETEEHIYDNNADATCDCGYERSIFNGKVYDNNGYSLNYQIYTPSEMSEENKRPLILFLHGAGERGNDNQAQLKNAILNVAGTGEWANAIIIAPQCPTDTQWVGTPWANGNYQQSAVAESQVMNAVANLVKDYAAENYVDTTRIYVVGLSMGGFGAWDIVSRYPDLFAAAVPICGGGPTDKIDVLKNIPIYTFHGSSDPTVPYAGTQEMYNAIIAAGGNEIIFHTFEGAKHGIWNQSITFAGDGDRLPSLESWLFAQRKHIHADPDVWETDGENHWYTCTIQGCNEKHGLAEHTFDNGTLTTPPSETVEGIETFKCTVCGYAKTSRVHVDANKDHACDFGCSGEIGICEDADHDHNCDYGCEKTYGEHADAGKDHVCDYGCKVAIGECVDADKDHDCDYGCEKTWGEHIDENNDHVCDYGCKVAIGECADADKDHDCDYGCDKTWGEHIDAGKDHVCDYGCKVAIGECVDADKDHDCDYGCEKTYGEHIDENNDHACDYGCKVAIGECADADKDHGCDYGCDKTWGEHADSADDLDHVCDYGCKEVLEECSDVLTDGDHSCDVCGKEEVTSHVYGEWAENDADTHKQTCNCGDVVTESHNWNDGEETEAPTCTEQGVKTFTCTVCSETRTEAIDYLDHNTVNHEAKAPTCTEIGWDAYVTCSNCDYSTKVEKDMLPHSYSWVVDQQPTLDAEGIKHEECVNCGVKRNENTTIDKLTCDHSEMTKIEAVAPTCLEAGNSEYYFCAKCNKYYSNIEGTLETTVEDNVIEALDHDIVIDEAVEPTCENTGLTKGEHCTRCDHKVEQEIVPAKGHDYESVVTEPTCNDKGFTTHTCANCSDSYVDSEVDSLGHDIVIDEAVESTCTETGLTKGEHCTRCDYKVEQEIVPVKDHDYESVVTEPTCNDKGFTTHTCANCSASYVDSEVDSLGHDIVINEAVEPTCENTGLTKGEYCTRCDHKVEQEIVPAKGHDYASVVTEPTCITGGFTTHTCANCFDSYVDGQVAATGKHSDADGDKHCDTEGCDVVYYVLTLDGVSVVTSSDSSSTCEGAYLPGTELTLVANVYKSIDSKTYMLVGFDLNAVDNRLVDDGANTITYVMPAADTSITAKYAEATTTFFSNSTFKDTSTYTPEGFTATKIENPTDPDLEGLNGWSLVIPDNTAATTSKTNNFTATALTAWGPDQEKLVRFVLKNRGDYDVTVEICGEYFGYLCSTGNVTVPAGSVVVAFMDYGPFSGAGTTCDFMLHVREDMKGDGSGTVQLDVVASAAKKYETKLSDFIVTSDKNVFMDFGESTESNNQANVAHASASGMNMRYWDQYGVMYFYGNNNTTADTYARERGNAIGGEAIDLTNGKTITIYVKVTNLYHAGGGKYSLVFTRGSSSLSASYLATQTVEFSEYGESHVYKIEIDPSKAGTSANLQFGLKKAKADGTGGKVNVLVQIASENIFGEEPVNQ